MRISIYNALAALSAGAGLLGHPVDLTAGELTFYKNLPQDNDTLAKTLLSLRARRSVAAPATAPVRTRVRYVPSIREETAPVESSIKTMVAGTLGRPRLGLSGYTETIFTPRAEAPGA